MYIVHVLLSNVTVTWKYMASQKSAIVMKGEVKDIHNTLIYFKSNLYERLF